ncbi:medium-chain fatty acid-CoA ligase faa2, partial [Coemansia nantahalensis]
NIVKLAQGEFVALEGLETVYSRHRLVESIFVHGDSLQAALVCVVVPAPEAFVPWARRIAALPHASIEELCADPRVAAALLAELADLARAAKLQGFEVVRAVFCEPVPFDIETNGLLTTTFKLKRSVARDYYRRQIDDMYAALAVRK